MHQEGGEPEAVFGDRLPMAEEFARLLGGPGLERGLIGPQEIDRLWDRHLVNSAVVAELIPEHASLIDIGSGAGLPGLALAIARPDLGVTLVESRLRATTFLTECVTSLCLPRVRVRRARAEDVAGEFSAGVVTARAVASLARLLEWAAPLLSSGGELLAWKGKRAEEELSGAGPYLDRLGVDAEVVRVGAGKVEHPATVIRLVIGATKGRRL